MEAWNDLANAIVEQASKDYVTAIKKRDSYRIQEIRHFFRSSYCGMLTNLDTEVLMKDLEKIAGGK